MDPTARYFQVFSFLTKLMVDLIPIRDHRSGEALQELSGMVHSSGWLPIIERDQMLGAVRDISIYPHVSLFAILDFGIVYAHALGR